jgi:hypothetical protein
MNDGVKILLERMKTHPEEFVPNNGSSKWGSLIAAYSPHLHVDDHVALRKGMDSLLQQAFTEKVLQELVDPVEESNVKKGNAFTQKFRRAALAATTPTIPSITLGEDKHLKAHLEALKALGQTPIAGVTQTL